MLRRDDLPKPMLVACYNDHLFKLYLTKRPDIACKLDPVDLVRD